MLAGRSRRGDAEVRLGRGEVEALGAVGPHRGARLSGVEPASVDLADVRHEVGLGVTRGLEETNEVPEELVVRECAEFSCILHTTNISSDPPTAQRGRWRLPRQRNGSREIEAHCEASRATLAP